MDKRAAFRFPTDVEADCRSCDRAWGTRLVNISTTGCMIACPGEGLPDGALLRLRVKGLTAIDGQIVWQHRDHAGIRFRVPLHPAVMEHLAFRGTDRGYDTAPPEPRSAPQPSAARAAPSLHGSLVKRTWTAPAEAEPRQASAG
jgi:hypothetical protein